MRAFVAGRETFPSKREFQAAGEGALIQAILRYGGTAHWAAEVGLPLKPIQERFSLSPDEAVAEARLVVDEHGHLPHADRLYELGHPKLATFVARAGGVKQFRARYGVTDSRS